MDPEPEVATRRRPLPGPRLQLLKVRDAGPRGDQQQHRVGAEQPHRREVAGGVVGHVAIEVPVDAEHADMGEQRGVPVRLRAGHPRCAHISPGAGGVLHHHGLAEAPPHRAGDQAGHDVRRAAWREGHHDRHGPARRPGRGRRLRAPEPDGSGRRQRAAEQGSPAERQERPAAHRGRSPASVTRCMSRRKPW